MGIREFLHSFSPDYYQDEEAKARTAQLKAQAAKEGRPTLEDELIKILQSDAQAPPQALNGKPVKAPDLASTVMESVGGPAKPQAEPTLGDTGMTKGQIAKALLFKKLGLTQQDVTDIPKDENGQYLTGDAYLNSLSPQDQNLVRGMTDYTLDPTKTFSNRGNNRAKYIGMASQADPTFDMMQYPTRQKFLQDWRSGTRSKNVTSFNTAIEHLKSLQDASQETPSSGIGFIEAGQRAYAKNLNATGPENLAMTRENAALSAVSGELANIFKNSSGTDQEIEKWFKAYDPNAPREAKREFVKSGVKLMESRLNALGADYNRTMGKDFGGQLLSPKAKQIIDGMGLGGAEAALGGGGAAQGQPVTSGLIEGKIYRDAQGNKAIYKNGQFVPAQ